MDGSIADSTMLRLRSGLGRVYQPTANTTANDFFEELLRLPVASSIDVQSDDSPDAADPTATLPTDQAPSAGSDDDSIKDQAQEEDEQAAEAPAAPVISNCYARPWSPPEPVPNAAPSEPGDKTKSIGQPDTSLKDAPCLGSNTKADDVVIQPEVKGETPEKAQQGAVLVSQDAIKPINPQTPAGPEQAVVTARDTRRTKIRDEKSGQQSPPSEHQLQQQPQVAAPTQPKPVAPVTADKETPSAETPSIKTESSPLEEAKAQTRQDDRRVPERDKWYESQPSETQAKIDELLAAEQTAQSHVDNELLTGGPGFKDGSTDVEATSVDANDQVSASVDGLNINEIVQSVTLVGFSGMAESATTKSAGSAEMAGVGATTGSGRVGSGSPVNGHTTHSSSISARGQSSTGTSASQTGETSSDEVQSRQLSQQERVRMVQRVARSFSRLGPDGGQVTLKLHPPQLGVLNVSIKIEGQAMTARLKTETSAARDVILDNLPVLKERLSEQGIEVEKFQVEVASAEEFASGQQGTTGDSPSGGAGGGRNEAPRESYDYRRVRREDATPLPLERSQVNDLRIGGWQDKSLDVKA